MLALVGHGTEHGLGGAKEWENEFRKRLKEQRYGTRYYTKTKI